MTVSPTEEGVDIEESVETEEPTKTDGEEAGSPPAEGEDAQGSMADAVKAALDRKSEDGESPTPGKAAEGQETEQRSEEEEDLGEVTEEELARYHSKTRRRVKGLIEQRDAARSESEGLKDKAGRFDGLMGYINKSGLAPEQVNQGFEVMSTLVKARTDPAAAQRALEMLTPLVTQLQQLLGSELPEDLADDVRRGYISQVRARELAQLRGTSQMHQASAHEREQQLTQERETAQRQELGRTISTSVSEWERAWKASDPDYAAKQPLVQESIELELHRRAQAGNPPQSAQDAIGLAKKARESVEARLRTFRPKQQRISDPLSADSGGNGRTAAEPKSMLEAMTLAARGSA
jgi:hypothetical protein